MTDDKVLISKLQNKDETALEQLYDKYSAALFGVIIRICKDEQASENILQDTFLTIWEKSDRYDFEKGRFYTWAHRIARNKTINFLRGQKNLIQTDELRVYNNKTGEVENEIDQEKLKGTLQKLDAHHQKAIELVYFNGLTHREAHEEMNVPLGTFKSYIKQAIKQLQKYYIKVVFFVLVLKDVIG